MKIIFRNVSLQKESFKLPAKYGMNTIFSKNGLEANCTFYKPDPTHAAYNQYMCIIVDVSSIVGETLRITTVEAHPSNSFRLGCLNEEFGLFENFNDNISSGSLVNITSNVVDVGNLVSETTNQSHEVTTEITVPDGVKYIVFNQDVRAARNTDYPSITIVEE